jgi:AcrR family transcriptional regulator
MVIKQRAIADVDKEVRRHAILDAALALFVQQPDRMASVSEVADAAGLAKGTVYLYFAGKEEMLLAVHERQTEHFFERFAALMEGVEPVDFDTIFELTRNHLLRQPGYLALTSWVFAKMDREMPLETAVAFKQRIGETLADAGGALERHYPTLGPGDGARLLQYSLATFVGLYQLIHPNQRFADALGRGAHAALLRDYEHEVERALRALWAGTILPPGKTAAKAARR